MLKLKRVIIGVIILLLLGSLVLNYDLKHFFYLLNLLVLFWLLNALFIFSKLEGSMINSRLGFLLVMSIITNQLFVINQNLFIIFFITVSILQLDVFMRINNLSKVKKYYSLLFLLLIISPLIFLVLETKLAYIYLLPILLNFLLITYLTQIYLDKEYQLLVSKIPQMSKKTFLSQLEIARKVQQEFLPKQNSIKNAKIHLLYEPLWQIGGDFCNIINLKQKGSYSLIIGDVVGKGLAAALVMTDLITTTQLISYETPDPSHVIKILNNRFCNNNYNQHSYYATACCMLIDMKEGILEICNAGHESPYIFRKIENKLVKIDKHDVMLGVDCDKIDYEKYSIKFEVGDILILYTDGLINVLDDKLENVLEDCLNCNGESIVDCINQGIKTSSKSVIDDFLLLIIEFGGV